MMDRPITRVQAGEYVAEYYEPPVKRPTQEVAGELHALFLSAYRHVVACEMRDGTILKSPVSTHRLGDTLLAIMSQLSEVQFRAEPLSPAECDKLQYRLAHLPFWLMDTKGLGPTGVNIGTQLTHAVNDARRGGFFSAIKHPAAPAHGRT